MDNGLFVPVMILISIGLGLGLGVLYFGGLWLTVQRLPTTHHPIQLTLVSLVTRLGLCWLGLFELLRLSQPNALLPLLSCVAAFFWVRNRMVQRLGFKPR